MSAAGDQRRDGLLVETRFDSQLFNAHALIDPEPIDVLSDQFKPEAFPRWRVYERGLRRSFAAFLNRTRAFRFKALLVGGPGVPNQAPSHRLQRVAYLGAEVAHISIYMRRRVKEEVAGQRTSALVRFGRDRIHDLGDLDFELAR